MANSNGWGDGAANNAIGWGQGANNSIGWGDSHAKSWAGATDIVGIDSDAQAFITAAAITDPVQINAINTLVEGMKTDGVWTKMKAIYPFVGGTASTHKYNLKDPRDLDAAFRLVFNGGWTHSSTGATPNGTNGYADTKLNAVVQGVTNTNNHLSVYSRTAAAAGSTQFYEMGSGSSGSNTNLSLWTRRSVNSAGYDSGSFSLNRNTFTNTNGQGFYNGNSLTTLSTYFKNGVNQNTKSITASALESVNIFLGGFNESNTITYYSNKQTAFSSIGDGLTNAEAANLYTRVQAFQTALSRQV
jgi:hypothetical protein